MKGILYLIHYHYRNTNFKCSLRVPYDQVSIVTGGEAALLVVKATELGCVPAEEPHHVTQLEASLTGRAPEQRQTWECLRGAEVNRPKKDLSWNDQIFQNFLNSEKVVNTVGEWTWCPTLNPLTVWTVNNCSVSQLVFASLWTSPCVSDCQKGYRWERATNPT